MGNVIDFLERVGRDASLRHGEGFDRALREHELDDLERAALAGFDAESLRLLLTQDVHLSTQMGEPFGPDERAPEVPPDDEDDHTDSDDPPASDA